MGPIVHLGSQLSNQIYNDMIDAEKFTHFDEFDDGSRWNVAKEWRQTNSKTLSVSDVGQPVDW